MATQHTPTRVKQSQAVPRGVYTAAALRKQFGLREMQLKDAFREREARLMYDAITNGLHASSPR